MSQSPLANQGPAAATVANEVNNIHARFTQLWKIKLARHAAQRRFIVGKGLLNIGDQAIQIDVGVDFFQLVTIVVTSVDLKNFHDQCTDVLDVHVQLHGFIWCKLSLVCRGKVDLNPLFQCLE